MGADYLAYALVVRPDRRLLPGDRVVGEELEELEDEAVDHPTCATPRPDPRGRVILTPGAQHAAASRRALRPARAGQPARLRRLRRLPARSLRPRRAGPGRVETYRDILAGMFDIYLSSVSNRMNEVMKVLTVIATIFIPLTFIAGVYGMNFEHMPELKWRYGYALFWGIMVAVGAGMLLFFRRKRWVGRGATAGSRRLVRRRRRPRGAARARRERRARGRGLRRRREGAARRGLAQGVAPPPPGEGGRPRTCATRGRCARPRGSRPSRSTPSARTSTTRRPWSARPAAAGCHVVDLADRTAYLAAVEAAAVQRGRVVGGCSVAPGLVEALARPLRRRRGPSAPRLVERRLSEARLGRAALRAAAPARGRLAGGRAPGPVVPRRVHGAGFWFGRHPWPRGDEARVAGRRLAATARVGMDRHGQARAPPARSPRCSARSLDVDNASHHYETIINVVKAAFQFTHWPTMLIGIFAISIMYGLLSA